MDDHSELLPIPHSYFLSLAHGQEYAEAMMRLQATLIGGIKKLRLLQATPRGANVETHIRIDGSNAASELPGGTLIPHASLLMLWKEFSEALRHLTAHGDGFVNLWIVNVQLSAELLSELEPALKTAPLRVTLINNRLGSAGVQFMSHMLKTNVLIKSFQLYNNTIVSRLEAISLANAATAQSHLKCFCLAKCDLGAILPTTPGIVPAFLSLKVVNLEDNNLGSCAASLISNHLATNPRSQVLVLADNVFNDADAALIAQSLKSNTNLRRLRLRGNNFTESGIKTLYRSVFGDRSLNAIHDSNHTCELRLFAKGQPVPNGIDKAMLSVNGVKFHQNALPPSVDANRNAGAGVLRKMFQMRGRRMIKITHALQGGNAGKFNAQYLNKVLLELMPTVLAFFLGSSKYSENSFDVIFQVVRSRPEVVPSYEATLLRDK